MCLFCDGEEREGKKEIPNPVLLSSNFSKDDSPELVVKYCIAFLFLRLLLEFILYQGGSW